MPALTEVHFQNYRSFLDAKCRLSPVTVVIGANNAGKSNFLRGLTTAAGDLLEMLPKLIILQHRDREFIPSRITLHSGTHSCDWTESWQPGNSPSQHVGKESWRGEIAPPPAGLYALNPLIFGSPEPVTETPKIHGNGRGVVAFLAHLAESAPDVFAELQRSLSDLVSEIDQLIPSWNGQGQVRLRIKEHGVEKPGCIEEVSSGTRMIIALLAIIYQPNRPELILLEDIERDIHPRGLKPLVETMRKISAEHGVQIVFTTQSPYVLDAFQDPQYWDDVVIVEKRDGVSTLTNAKERLVALGYEREMDKVPLGDLWYSGLLGGVAGPNELWDEEEPKPDAK